MAYFPAAYRKVLIATNGYDWAGSIDQLGKGMFGFYNANTWQGIDVPDADAAVHPKVVLAVGNPYHKDNLDKHGPHGGYTESLKSPVIDARSIDRFWKVKARSARIHSVVLGWDELEHPDGTPSFTCGQTYWLRVDLKGASVLRFLGHNLYRLFSISTECCAQAGEPDPIDPIAVLIQFAKQINEDPIFSPFITALVQTSDPDALPILVDPTTYTPLTNPVDIANTVASLQLVVTYQETKFNACSFDPNDHYDAEPLVIAAAQWVNIEGKSCPNVPHLAFTKKQAPLAAEGTSDRLLRDYLLSISYRQDFYAKDARMRLITDMNTIAADLNQYDKYVNYYLLHRVPRKSNPTGNYDQDQYLTQVALVHNNESGIEFFESWLQNYLNSAGTGVVLEDLSGELDPT